MFRSKTSCLGIRLTGVLLTVALVTRGFKPISARSIGSETTQINSLLQISEAAANSPIYADVLAAAWEDWSWNTDHNFGNAEPVHSGSASIAVTYTAAWGGLLLHTKSAVSTSDYIAIRFWVHGGITGGQSVNFHVNEGTEYYSFTVPANAWLQVTVPLALLGNPASLSDLFWQDASDGSQPTYYIDDISLVETSQVYTDALSRGWMDYTWGTDRNFDNTEPVHSGSASIAVTYTEPYGSLILHRDTAISTSDYDAVLFWVHGGSTGGQSVNFHVNDGTEYYSFTVQANTWLPITVPLAELGNPVSLSDLLWQDGSNGSQPIYYIDDISLVKIRSGTWTEATSPVTYPLQSVAILSANDGWAVGYQGFYPNGNLQGSVILRRQGNSWSEWGSDASGPALYSAATVSASDGWAVGSNSSNGSAIKRWNGSAWDPVPNPGGQILRSIAMVSANDGWAVGAGGNCIQGSHLQGTIMRWDGNSWSAISDRQRVIFGGDGFAF